MSTRMVGLDNHTYDFLLSIKKEEEEKLKREVSFSELIMSLGEFYITVMNKGKKLSDIGRAKRKELMTPR